MASCSDFTEDELKVIEFLKTKDVPLSMVEISKQIGIILKNPHAFLLKCESKGVLLYEERGRNSTCKYGYFRA